MRYITIEEKEEGIQLAFRTSFLDALQRVGDEYDLLAECYLELLTYVGDYDMSFVSTRVSGRVSEGGFRTAMSELRKSILSSLQEGECTGDVVLGHSCAGLIGALQKIDSPDEDLPVYLFLVIHILDGYVCRSLAELDEHRSLKYDSGPLNCGESLQRCLIYPQTPGSMMRESRKEFRRPLKSDRIGSLMPTVLLVERDKLLHREQEPPRIVHITPSPAYRAGILGKKSIRISSIPYIGFRTIKFHNLGEPEPCKKDKEIRGSFYVEYPLEWEEANEKRIIELLKAAIQEGAHIIIFPEFIMSEGMKAALQKHLQSIGGAERKQLLLVLAGTTVHGEGDSTFHNVLHLFDAEGNEIGHCYKFSPYRMDGKKDPKNGEREPLEYFQCCEILSAPGKECTLIDMDGVGRILPLICRDVSDGTWLHRLTDALDPDLVLVPAWSRSVSTFQLQLEERANTHLIGSLLCNCCNAVSDRGEDGTKTGLLCLPHKSGSVMKADCSFIERPAKCVETCQECGGCVVPVTLDFSQTQPVGHIGERCFPDCP